MSRAAVWTLFAASLLAGAAGAQTPPPNPPPAQPPPQPAASPTPEASPAPNLLVERLNLKPTFEVRGRIQADAVMAAQSPQSLATIGDLQNGFGFRRVRLGAEGKVGDSASWVSEVELAGGAVRLRDVFVGLDALPGVRQVRVGHFREPYSLEGATSANVITFLERSPLNVLDPTRNWGVCGYWQPDDQRGLFAAGLFRSGTGSDGQSLGDGSQLAATTRFTWLPVYEPDGDAFRRVHLGAAFTYRNPADGLVTYAPEPQSTLLTVSDNPSSPFLPPVVVPAYSVQGYNLQAARVVGPLSLQAEWFGTAVQQNGGGVVFVHGFYADVSYFPTGEHRGYSLGRGAFDQVAVRRPLIRDRNDPRGGCGAIELAARFSYADFDSPNLPPATDGAPAGASLYQVTLGTNWYLNDYTRIMFNYTAGFTDSAAAGPAVAHLFGIRTAIFW